MRTPLKSSARLLCCLAITVIAFTIAATIPAGAQVNGALYNTDVTGTKVDYTVQPPLSCDQVYITGGPQNTHDAGLSPVGVNYYFQVTDPSGKVVLSVDAGVVNGNVNDRQVTTGTVNGKGVITGTAGSHPIGQYNAASGETTVLLWPFQQTPNNGGVYKTWISTDPNFTNSTTKTDNFKCVYPQQTCPDPTNPLCQGPPPTNADITGIKFYDADTNGVQNGSEVGIANWLIQINPVDINGASCQLTGGSGSYDFAVTPDTLFTISEGTDITGNSTWHHTTATSGSVTSGDAGTTTAGPNFGNVCVGAGGGLTLGYWSNKNGQATMGCKTATAQCASELAFLSGLNLRNANGSNFDPATYAAFNTWLLSANATNMAYMLSAQLSAMELNVLNAGALKSGLTSSSLVFVGTPPAGCSLTPNAAGFVTVGALMTDANTLLGADGLTLSGNPDRTCQEFDKTALDNANNNLTFVEPNQNSCPAFSFDTTSCIF